MLTGDKYADFRIVFQLCYENKTIVEDILFLLDNVGINNYASELGTRLKCSFKDYLITLFVYMIIMKKEQKISVHIK